MVQTTILHKQTERKTGKRPVFIIIIIIYNTLVKFYITTISYKLITEWKQFNSINTV